MRIVLLLLMTLFLSACATTASTRVVNLSANQQQVQTTKNHNLKISVSDKLPSLANLGGSDGMTTVQFQNPTLWLTTQLRLLNKTKCQLKHKIRMNVTIKKLYIVMENDNLVGNIELLSKYYKDGIAVGSKRYWGQCEGGILGMTGTTEIRLCLKTALYKIMDKMARDICHKSR